jgi:hypothetical protein
MRHPRHAAEGRTARRLMMQEKEFGLKQTRLENPPYH